MPDSEGGRDTESKGGYSQCELDAGMPSSSVGRILATSSQLLTHGSRRRPFLYRPGSSRGGRKGPVQLWGAIPIALNAEVEKVLSVHIFGMFGFFIVSTLEFCIGLCKMSIAGSGGNPSHHLVSTTR
jgi:hypothetical protein